MKDLISYARYLYERFYLHREHRRSLENNRACNQKMNNGYYYSFSFFDLSPIDYAYHLGPTATFSKWRQLKASRALYINAAKDSKRRAAQAYHAWFRKRFNKWTPVSDEKAV